MKTTKSILALLLCGALLAEAAADPVTRKLWSNYESADGKMTLRTLQLGDDQETVAAEITFGAPECTGSFAGIGNSDGKAIRIRPYRSKEPASQSCELTIKLDRTGKAATVSENRCSDYHGAQCAFNGTLRSK